MNQSYELLPTLQSNTSFQKRDNHTHCPSFYLSDQSDEEFSYRKQQNYEVWQDRIVCSPFFSSVLSTSPRVPQRLGGEVTFNAQRQRYEFTDWSGFELDLSFVIYHEHLNKCHYVMDTSKLRSAPLSTFPNAKFALCGDRRLQILSFKIQLLRKKISHQVIQWMFLYVCTGKMTIVRRKCSSSLRNVGVGKTENPDIC